MNRARHHQSVCALCALRMYHHLPPPARQPWGNVWRCTSTTLNDSPKTFSSFYTLVLSVELSTGVVEP
jgi:hypothetical protein